MSGVTRAFQFVVVLAALAPVAGLGQSRAPELQCRAAGTLAAVPELSEASGLAMSRRVPGRLWTHNDGQPILYALDTRGAITGRVRLSGVTVEDWEAVAVGPCPAGSCVYVGDIGDNDRTRRQISVYRFPEPEANQNTAAVKEVFHATYPDGAHDAEALLVTSDGDIAVVTKGETGPVALYRFPRDARAGATQRLERVGSPNGSARPARTDRVTDGAVSADGQWTILRTGQQLKRYRTAELMKGNWREEQRVDLRQLGEPQGEGVAMGDDHVVYLIGEGGGKLRAGTFARLSCTP